VFLTLLKGDLLSDGIGLISHRVLWILIGIYGRILFLMGWKESDIALGWIGF